MVAKMHLLALAWLVACCMLQHAEAEVALLLNTSALQRSGEWVQVVPATRHSFQLQCIQAPHV